jgi:predicted RNase H-like HicB family nuclease
MLRAFTILIEEDYASNNFCIYVPELRLNVVGDTEEEALNCAKDLIAIECEKTPKLQSFTSKVMTIQVEVSVESTIQNYSNAV